MSPLSYLAHFMSLRPGPNSFIGPKWVEPKVEFNKSLGCILGLMVQYDRLAHKVLSYEFEPSFWVFDVITSLISVDKMYINVKRWVPPSQV